MTALRAEASFLSDQLEVPGRLQHHVVTQNITWYWSVFLWRSRNLAPEILPTFAISLHYSFKTTHLSLDFKLSDFCSPFQMLLLRWMKKGYFSRLVAKKNLWLSHSAPTSSFCVRKSAGPMKKNSSAMCLIEKGVAHAVSDEWPVLGVQCPWSESSLCGTNSRKLGFKNNGLDSHCTWTAFVCSLFLPPCSTSLHSISFLLLCPFTLLRNWVPCPWTGISTSGKPNTTCAK